MNPASNRFWTVAYYVLAGTALAYVLWALSSAEHFYGTSGQPRSASIPPGWVVPWQLSVYLLATTSVYFLAPREPLLGVAAYFGLVYAFPVHTPEWIFVHATWLRLIAAVLASSAATLYAFQHGQALWPFHGLISGLLLAFVCWNLVCATIAALSIGGYQPALQFHPNRLLESLAISSVLLRCKNADRPLVVITVMVVITLLAQTTFAYGIRFRDAGIASDIVIALPLLCYAFVKAPRWWLRSVIAAIGVAAIWILVSVENRGSAVAFLLSLLAALAISRHRIRLLAIGFPLAVIGIFGFLSTSFGDRFRSIGNLSKVLESNERVLTWRAGLDMAIDHPMFGVGPGNFVNRVGAYAPDFAHHSAHNLWIDILAESGLPGFVLYTTLMVVILLSCIRNSVGMNSDASRWIFVSLVAFMGVGIFLTTTMFVFPYALFAIVAIDRNRVPSLPPSTS